MTTSASGTGNGNGGGGLLSGLLGGGSYNYGGTWREKFGSSLFTDRQAAIHAQRAAEAELNRHKLSRGHTAALRENINRAAELTGGPKISTEGVSNVAQSTGTKTDFRHALGVAIKV